MVQQAFRQILIISYFRFKIIEILKTGRFYLFQLFRLFKIPWFWVPQLYEQPILIIFFLWA